MCSKVRHSLPYFCRTTMSTKIDTVSARDKLPPRREPYWRRMSVGCHIGYRAITKGGEGAWIAKYRDPSTGLRHYKSLGALDHLPPYERHDAASKAATEWFEHLGRGGSKGVKTVRDACKHYVEHLKGQQRPDLTPGAKPRKNDDAAHGAAQRLKNHVLSDSKVADVELSKLTPAILDGWRKRLRARVQISGPDKGKPRADSTVNRDMTAFRAALNLALADGWVTSDFAWRTKLEPIANADGRRLTYLTKEQRTQLIEKAPPDLAVFLQAMASLPLRPGALAALRVGDFDQRFGALRIGKDKAGADRWVKLPQATAAVFAHTCTDKLPVAHIFTRADGAAWNKDSWYDPIKAAVTAAGLPAEATAYTLRHSTVTDLVHQGRDLLTVAQLSGTSVAMIERHYGHLRQQIATAALEQLAI